MGLFGVSPAIKKKKPHVSATGSDLLLPAALGAGV